MKKTLIIAVAIIILAAAIWWWFRSTPPATAPVVDELSAPGPGAGSDTTSAITEDLEGINIGDIDFGDIDADLEQL